MLAQGDDGITTREAMMAIEPAEARTITLRRKSLFLRVLNAAMSQHALRQDPNSRIVQVLSTLWLFVDLLSSTLGITESPSASEADKASSWEGACELHSSPLARSVVA